VLDEARKKGKGIYIPDPFIADALLTRRINAYLHTAYRVEEIEQWPEHRIDQLLFTMGQIE